MTGTASREPIPEGKIREYCTEKLYAVMGELAAAYRYAKDRHGINQEALTARLNKSKGQVSRILNTPKNITVWNMSEMALGMECDVTFKITPVAELPALNYRHQPEAETVAAQTTDLSGVSSPISDDLPPRTTTSGRATFAFAG